MQLELEKLCVLAEIPVRCVDGERSTHCRRTDQKVRVRSLDTTLAASVARCRSFFVVRRLQLQIWKRSKVVAQQLELGLCLYTGQQLLPNRPEQYNSAFAD